MTRGVEDSAWAALAQHLRLRAGASAAELSRALGVSQPTFSRLTSRHEAELLVTGKGRSTRYALRRTVAEVGDRAPIFEIDEAGGARRLATLHAVTPTAFYVAPDASDVDAGFRSDLPYFLYDLRPSGFLGRLVPRRHPELSLPTDVRLWSSDQCLRYLSAFGSDGIGALIVGEVAFQRHLERATALEPALNAEARELLYPELAADLQRAMIPGSSAGGEQPKFLVSRQGQDFIVKFGPPGDSAVARRISDLLVAEHVAHDVLRRRGVAAATSRIVRSAGRTFLEIERFDRTRSGRRGLLSLLALDAEFVGDMRSWSRSVQALERAKRVPAGTVRQVQWLETFGKLIANSDMHAANLSFFTRGTRVVGLAPAYDMAPAFYVSDHGEVVDRDWRAPMPDTAAAPYWRDVCGAAAAYWLELAKHSSISKDFRAVARGNARKVQVGSDLADHLPR